MGIDMDQWLQGFRDEHSLIVTVLIAIVAVFAVSAVLFLLRRSDAHPNEEEIIDNFMGSANKRFLENVKDRLDKDVTRKI